MVFQCPMLPQPCTGYPSELQSRTWVGMMAADYLTVYLAEVNRRSARPR